MRRRLRSRCRSGRSIEGREPAIAESPPTSARSDRAESSAAPVVVQPAASPAAPVLIRPAASLAVVGDAGSLPNPGIGVEIGASLNFRFLRVAAVGALFATQQTRVSGDAGGEFQLVTGAGLACLPVELANLTLLGCGGYELGRLSADGIGVSRPRFGSALWQAARVEVAVAIPLNRRLALLLRGGAAIPISRPDFFIEGDVLVHQPSNLTGRFAAGIELGF